MPMFVFRACIALLFLVSSSSFLSAELIKFTISGTAEGTLHDQQFGQNQSEGNSYVLEAIGDTDDIEEIADPNNDGYFNYRIVNSSWTAIIEMNNGSFETVSAVNTMRTVSNNFAERFLFSQYPNFPSSTGAAFFLITQHPAFATYKLDTELAPVEGTGLESGAAKPGIPMPVSGISFVSGGVGDLVFGVFYTATVEADGPNLVAVPEPNAVFLLLLTGIAMTSRRRRA